MKQEDKELLLKDLCARLLYGVKVLDDTYKKFGASDLINIGVDGSMLVDNKTEDIQYHPIIDNVKPYLRSMSSMTEEEKLMYEGLMIGTDNISYMLDVIDWLNAHHFDYCGLIEKGLALEVSEGIYNLEKK